MHLKDKTKNVIDDEFQQQRNHLDIMGEIQSFLFHSLKIRVNIRNLNWKFWCN